MAAGAMAALHPAPPPCLRQVDEVVWTIHTQLTRVSQKPLQDILRRTLLRLAHLYTHEVTTGLLQASPHCDRYVARQPQGQLRTSGACPGRRGGGRGGPTDGVLWLCSTARVMWSVLASEPCLADDVLKTLLRVQRKNARRRSFKGECICCSLLAVSVWRRPAPPCPGLRIPLQPLLPPPPAPKPGPPQGRLGQGPWGHSQAGQRVLLGAAVRRQAACPCPCCPQLSSSLPTSSCLLGCREARGRVAAWPERAAGPGRGSPGQPAEPLGPAGLFPLGRDGSHACATNGSRALRAATGGLQARHPGWALPWHLPQRSAAPELPCHQPRAVPQGHLGSKSGPWVFSAGSQCHARDLPGALQPMLRAVTSHRALRGSGLPDLLQLEWPTAGLLLLSQSEK